MLENKLKETFTIFDSDEVDTIDSFIVESDIINTENQNEDCHFEKIDLDKFTKELKQSNATPRPCELGEMYKRDIENRTKEILEPVEFLEIIQSLTTRTEDTIERLKNLQSKCSLGIVDLQHKIEFESLDIEEGKEILDTLRKVIIYQRCIKDVLEKYKSIAQLTQMLDKTFISSQIEKLDKVEDFQASRIYTPRVFNVVERKNYPSSKISIQTIEKELSQLINSTNNKYEKV